MQVKTPPHGLLLRRRAQFRLLVISINEFAGNEITDRTSSFT